MSDQGQDGNSVATGAPTESPAEATIEDYFFEERQFPPSPGFVSQAVVSDPGIYQKVVVDQRRLLGGRDPVTRDVHHIIDPSEQPQVVAESAVVGAIDPTTGQSIVAFVTPVADAAAPTDE